MELPEIVGVAGTNGSGKDTFAYHRSLKAACKHVTVSDILREHLRAEGIPLERKNLADLSRQWREQSGDHGILVTKTIHTYIGEKALIGYQGLSVVSIRHPQEAMRIKENDGVVVWVDAEPRRRYERVATSGRGRVDDQKTFDEFVEEEAADMYPGEDPDPARVNMSAVRDEADIHIYNNFDLQSEYLEYLSRRFEL
jgi:cytidylate kinase